jgi:hypothetical protein
VNPRLSIAIPTRNRSDLARLAIRHLLMQEYPDFEVIVLDNSDDESSRISDGTDPRCRVVRASSVLSMPANWERALSEATGDYLIILSDKDMMVSGALARIADVIERHGSDVVSFRKAACFESGGWSFVQRCTGEVAHMPFQPVVAQWFDKVQHMHDAPMIYNSAVRLSVVRDIAKRAGRFFVGSGPDVASSVLLGAYLPSYTLLDRPLVVSLFGPWSIGGATSKGRQGAAEKWLAEFAVDPLHSLGVIDGIPGVIAETITACKAAHREQLKSFSVNWSSYISGALRELDERRQGGVNVQQNIRSLRNLSRKPYSMFDLLKGWLVYSRETRVVNPLLKRLQWFRRFTGAFSAPEASRGVSIPFDVSEPASAKKLFTNELRAYTTLKPSPHPSFYGIPYASLSQHWKIEEMLMFVASINCSLDEPPNTRQPEPAQEMSSSNATSAIR